MNDKDMEILIIKVNGEKYAAELPYKILFIYLVNRSKS